MHISDSQLLTIGEKMRLAAEAEYARSEKAISPASGADLGLPRDEETRQQESMLSLRDAYDSFSLSESARSRFRAAAGENTEDSTKKKELGAGGLGTADLNTPEESSSVEKIRKKIREVEKQLREAMAKMGEAAADSQEVQENVPGPQSPLSSNTSAPEPLQQHGDAQAQQEDKEVEEPKVVAPLRGVEPDQGQQNGAVQQEQQASAAEAKVNELSGQLMGLYKELMEALKSEDKSK